MNSVIKRDLERVFNSLDKAEKDRAKDSSILVTGGAGFIGCYLLSFLCLYKIELGINRIVCLDNFALGKPTWLDELSKNSDIEVYNFDIINDDISSIPGAGDIDYICHMASIASPPFYREYPIETVDANVWGLRRLLDYYKDKEIKKLAFFSSSEIYGDPSPENIPTPEEYNGNVDCKGPRACYDESKRFGETMCYLYNKKYEMPIVVIRPFNNYGPGMRLNDARVSADFLNAVMKNKDIEIFSDGSPTRTFCYISDTVTGYLKCLLSNYNFETFNIGSDEPEITITNFATICVDIGRRMSDYSGQIKYLESKDKDYLSNNPTRRCPDISKARKMLNFNPQVELDQGIEYTLEFILESTEEDLVW